MFHGTSRLGFVLFGTSLLLTVLSCAQFQAADPLVGSWTMNAARSKFNPGPAPKSITVTYAQAGQALHVVSVLVTPDGASARTEYTAAYDGKDYPIQGVPDVETVSLRQIDALTSERIDKHSGKQVQSYTRQVYADGRTLIVTQKGTDGTGAPVNNVIVFDKAPAAS
jgi:hypothetical protein